MAMPLFLVGLHCIPTAAARQGADINALELACVDVAPSREASRDCRNAVRRAWAKANGITIVDLDGGSHE